jgi:hypothetical protein
VLLVEHVKPRGNKPAIAGTVNDIDTNVVDMWMQGLVSDDRLHKWGAVVLRIG